MAFQRAFHERKVIPNSELPTTLLVLTLHELPAAPGGGLLDAEQALLGLPDA